MRYFYGFFLILAIAWFACDGDHHSHRIRPLAQDHIVIDRSSDPEQIYLGTPGIARLNDGRLVATLDQFGPGVKNLTREDGSTGFAMLGKIFTSDDGGRTWTFRSTFPFCHARPFIAGDRLYLLGHSGDLMISVSDDRGETWSEARKLTEGQSWHGSSDNVWYAGGQVYLVMEKHFERGLRECWRIGDTAPILLRAPESADLTRAESWTFASPLVFEDVVSADQLDFFGVPFYPVARDSAIWLTPDRPMSPMGWLETHVVQFSDPRHFWTDSTGHTFHLFMRAHTGRTGYAAIARVVEQPDGNMITGLESAPSGKKILYTPFPGGQMKFFVLWDGPSQLFWMVGTQATDSMTRLECLPADRYNLPDNERRRLVLHFSKNMIDWCFAGLVAIGPVESASRHYCAMTVDGDDLLIVSRSGDEQALNAHNGNLITFHRIENFRGLVY